MANITNFASPEQINGAGSVYANNLTIFGQQVLADFHQRNLMSSLILNSTIVDSKTKQFPRIGTTTSGYHVAGVEVLGQAAISNKVSVSVDDRPIIADVTIDDAEQTLSHYDGRAHWAKEMSRSISDDIDARIIQVLVNASKLAAPVTGGPVGGTAAVANMDTAAVLTVELFTAVAYLAKRNVDVSNLRCVLDPTVFYNLAKYNDVVNKDLNEGNGGFDQPKDMIKIAGVKCFSSNSMPTGVVAANPFDGNVYAGTFTNLVGVVFAPEAAMTLVAQPLMTESDGYSVKHQATTFVTKTLQGTGTYQNESAYSLFTI